jgi:hypothetical protein
LRRNFDLSTGLVAIGAAAVLVSLFLDWYVPGLSAWDVFEIVDWALVALAAGALVVLGGEASATTPPTQRLAWIAGLVALLVVSQLIDPPPAVPDDASREVGAWIALAGAALMVTGAVLRLMRISVTIDVAERERRRRTAAVDARGHGEARDEAAAASPSPAGSSSTAAAEPASNLWKGPAADDPDRTQPLPPAERPHEAG